MFIDEAQIKIHSGKGGDGAVSFRHEKYVPRGGPDGGDGGNGGDVIAVLNKSVHGLEVFSSNKEFYAQDGENGKKQKAHGKYGNDLILNVPPGTVITDTDTGKQLADFKNDLDKAMLAKGGMGGFGNARLAKPNLQTPRFAKKGKGGETKNLHIEIRYIADVGIIGLPNSGKSTLLSVITSARPKIANYPFTSLNPTLGRLDYYENSAILADVPGLIKFSSKGKGLGDKFLKHILRTKILLHLISCESENIVEDVTTINDELAQFNQELFKKNIILVMTKTDLMTNKTIEKKVKVLRKKFNQEILTISSATGKNLDELKKIIFQTLDKIKH